MTSTTKSIAAAVVAAMVAVPAGVTAQPYEAKDREALARAMADAKVRLEAGLAAGAKEGKPISAKYELEDGKLQLSVYTSKGDGFSEVIVDHGTGKVAKAEPITSGEDLAAAREQRQAMSKAKRSLQAVTADATRRNPGWRAVSAVPRIEEGRAVATVTLLQGEAWKTVSVPLDGAR
jgi:hypothetical protein